MKTRGFTLIELLVVIAIIGILSSVVLASLTTARTRGTAAAVQSELANMRAQAELYYSTTGNNSYGASATDCTAGMYASGVSNGLYNLHNGATNKGATVDCFASSTSWSVVATYNSVNYCVDGTGYSGTSSSATADGAC